MDRLLQIMAPHPGDSLFAHKARNVMQQLIIPLFWGCISILAYKIPALKKLFDSFIELNSRSRAFMPTAYAMLKVFLTTLGFLGISLVLMLLARKLPIAILTMVFTLLAASFILLLIYACS